MIRKSVVEGGLVRLRRNPELAPTVVEANEIVLYCSVKSTLRFLKFLLSNKKRMGIKLAYEAMNKSIS